MTAFPADLPLRLDAGVRVLAGGRVLVGGQPMRILRLSASGAAAVAAMEDRGPGPSDAARRLARTLVDGGLAHPAPPPAGVDDVTVVVPVRDRTALLDACLRSAAAPAIVVDDGSRDPAAVAEVCSRHGARLVRLETSGGPASARNAGLALVDTPLVAFLDSDCRPAADWLAGLLGHFADPQVAAVAPRIRPAAAPGALAAFAADRSPLDLGPAPARMVPMGRVSYVPTAALVVRRSALDAGFDDRLRYGEDVDLVWRLHEQGHAVRYEPAVCVEHREPERWRDLMARHYRYGTSAAALARRHPGRMAPLVLEPWSVGPAACLLARRPRPAAALLVFESVMALRRARAAGVPGWEPATWPVRGVGYAVQGAGHALAQLAPAALVALLLHRRSRPAGLALTLAPPLAEWARRRPRLDPARWAALCLADDAAYGLGVWAGCLRERVWAPLVPVVARRKRAHAGDPGS